MIHRVYHHHRLWEDHAAGLWARVEPADSDRALPFMRHTSAWGGAMATVVTSWRYATEHNLSNLEQNRVAWLGQAAVCYATGLPAVTTRRTWWALTEDQRNDANRAALTAIEGWEATWDDTQLQLTF